MRVVSKSALNEFIEKVPKAAEPLLRWYMVSKEAGWKNFSEMKNDFGSVDAIGDELYVFNVGGNKYRIIARVYFTGVIYIRFVGTHAEYDQVNISDL